MGIKVGNMSENSKQYSGELGNAIREKMRALDREDRESRKELERRVWGKAMDNEAGWTHSVGCAPDQEDEDWRERMFER